MYLCYFPFGVWIFDDASLVVLVLSFPFRKDKNIGKKYIENNECSSSM